MINEDYEIASEFQTDYRYSHDFWGPFTKDAQAYTLAASGYAWSDKERQQLKQEGREPLEMNIMRRPLQFFSGYLRDNLNSVIVEPVEGSDQKTADQFTKLMYYIWDKGKGYSTFLNASDECFKSGISLCGIQMDYSKDFLNGEISFYNRTYNSFYLDPTFEKTDLSDCGFAITRDLLDKNVIKQLLPFIDPQVIDDIQGSFRDDKFLSYHPNFTTLSRNRNLLAYDQYYKRRTRTRKFLVDPFSGFYRDVSDLGGEEKKKLEMGIERIKRLHMQVSAEGGSIKGLPPILEIKNVERNYIQLNVMLNGQRVYCGEDKTGIVETYPFVPLICYMEPSIWMASQRIQGISASLWSTQRQFNKRHMKIVDMMDSTISTGYKYLLGSVPDPSDLQQSGQNRIIGVDPDKAPEGLNSVQELSGGTTSPALIEYQQILDSLTLTLANMNESNLGIDEKGNTQVSGRLAQVRIAQGLRGNRKIFDNVEESQQLIGGLVLKAIQLNYNPEKVKRILGEDPTEQFYEKDFEQYDAVLSEGVRSKTQKDAYYYELINLKRDGILDVPQTSILKNLPMAGKSDLENDIAEQEKKANEINQKTQALQMELAQAEIDDKKALANERNTRSDSNEGLRVERASEAVQNEAQAVLDRAKAITELSKMKGEHLMNVIQFLRQLDAESKNSLNTVNEEVERRSDEEEPGMKNAEQELESIASKADLQS